MKLWQRQMASHGYICAFPKMVKGSSWKRLDHSVPKLLWPMVSPFNFWILSWQHCQLQRCQPKTIKTRETADFTFVTLKKMLFKNSTTKILQIFKTGLPKISKNMSEKFLLCTFLLIVEEIRWTIQETGIFILYAGDSQIIWQSLHWCTALFYPQSTLSKWAPL